MRTIKNILEQYREKGRFKPIKPRYVSNLSAASPRPASDSANVKLKEDGGLAQNTLLDKKKKPMSTATAENSFQSVKEVAEIGDESSSTEASANIAKKGGKTVIVKTLDQMKEAKEKSEYDYEGDMARGQLQSIVNNAQRVHDMLKDNDNLPEWVQSKITLAEDYISTVANYMMSEIDEEVVVEAEKNPHTSALGRALYRDLSKEKKASPQQVQRNKERWAKRQSDKEQSVAEDVEQVDEVSTDGYHKAAVKSRMDAAVKVMSSMGQDKAAKTKLDARNRGLKRLSDRTSAAMKKANSGSQKPRVGKEPTEAERRGYGQGRYMGDSVEVNGNQITEGRPSQRHPLEGHEYHKKSDEALIHIAKDAHAAAEAMKGHNTTAENKYRDQANDSATVRHFRKTSGMPDWYKKKYGHMKESFRPMDEPNMNLSIQARQKKADDNKPPFEGPYKKTTGVVTDKSGAKHGPMSVARNLARQALKKQASKMSVKESLEESRKAEIVKEIMKKGKKKEDNTFQGEPELGTTVVKADN